MLLVLPWHLPGSRVETTQQMGAGGKNEKNLVGEAAWCQRKISRVC